MKVVRLVLIMVVVLSAVMSVNAQKKNEKTAGSADGLLTIVSFFYLTIAKKD